MKHKLTLLLLALFTTIGAWAGVGSINLDNSSFFRANAAFYKDGNIVGSGNWCQQAVLGPVTLSGSLSSSDGKIEVVKYGPTSLTISVPSTLTITGYSLGLQIAQVGTNTCMVNNGGSDITLNGSSATTISASGLSTNSVTINFTGTGDNYGECRLEFSNFTINVEGTWLSEGTVVSDPSQLSNTKVYTIKTPRGYLTIGTNGKTIVSSHTGDWGTANANAATDDASKQFGILKIDDKYFIYSPKLNKFACFDGWDLVFHADRGMPLEIKTDGAGNPDGSSLRLSAYKFGTNGGNKFYLTNENGGGIKLNNNSTLGTGNTVTIEEVAGTTLDQNAAMEVFNAVPSEIFNEHKVYNIINQRCTNWSANSGNNGLIGTNAYSGSTADQQKFAFIKYNGKPCLYNVAAKKFVATDGSLTDNTANAATINTWYTSNATYKFAFFIEETGKLFNVQTDGSFTINGWNSRHDEGNMQGLTEVADATCYAEMLSLFELQPALNAITDGGTYRITTTAPNGTKYYVTTSGGLTPSVKDGGVFTITKTSGGAFGTGIRIDSGTERFTNPSLINNKANLTQSNYSHSTGDRTDYERQVFFLNDEGKFAIRSCNTASATSSWGDAGRTFWTYSIASAGPTPCYSYDPDHTWSLEKIENAIVVTYELYESDETTEVEKFTVKQSANSAVDYTPFTTAVHNNLLHNIFCYDYAVFNGTIGTSDCTIKVKRTAKSGTVTSLSSLSNNKAYNIGCKRGAFLATDDYLVSTDLPTYYAEPLGKFAIINYEDNYYLYSVDKEKFVTTTVHPGNNTKYACALTDDLINNFHGTEDALHINAETSPYFKFYFTIESVGLGLNTNGGSHVGYVIDTWTAADPGNMYFMVEAADFDPTDALAALEAYFHPAYKITYVIKDTNNNTLATFADVPAVADEHITTLPADYQRPFYTYNDVDVTISEQNTTIEFTATWAGPFNISADFANAHWYDMAMRSTWYVTSAVEENGAYKTQNANTMGLVEDSYQWAFIGNGYDGFKIINKAEGDGKSFGWTDEEQKDTGIPTIMADNTGHHLWKIVPSTNTTVPANSFCLNVSGTNLYINQYGGAGGSLKFWNSANNPGDAGSAFTVFDVPTNFASFVVDEISPYFESDAKYFVFTDATKNAIAYDESYKTECTFAQYSSMRTALNTALADITSFVLPETGYYLLKNKYYGTYMGIDPSDANMYGNYADANAAKNIVKLTKTGNGTYTISLMGKFAPNTITQSGQVTGNTTAGTYTVVIPSIGYAAFSIDPTVQMSCLHRDGSGKIVGWEAPAAASLWEAIDATSIQFEIGANGNGYATAYLPFPYTTPVGVKAYTGTISGSSLSLTEVSGTVPASTPVVLKGTAGTDNTFTIAAEEDAISGNALKGSWNPVQGADGIYALAKKGEVVGFYPVSTSISIPVGKAYLDTSAGVKGFTFVFDDDDATGINSLNVNENLNEAIYNVAGQRLNKMQKGINIVNGKKILK